MLPTKEHSLTSPQHRTKSKPLLRHCHKCCLNTREAESTDDGSLELNSGQNIYTTTKEKAHNLTLMNIPFGIFKEVENRKNSHVLMSVIASIS